jgi:hypothetical protein
MIKSTEALSRAHHPELPHKKTQNFRFIESGERYQPSLQALFDEIIATNQPVNGLHNPVYEQTAVTEGLVSDPAFYAEAALAGTYLKGIIPEVVTLPKQPIYNAQYYVDSVAAKARISPEDPKYAEKAAAVARFYQDAEKLVARIEEFKAAFELEFKQTALYDRSKTFTAQIVIELRQFLITWIPEKFPIWDHNPFTPYSPDEQKFNFQNKTLQHIDTLLIYTFEYFTRWNELVAQNAREDQDQSQLQVDVNFAMCRALLHDLGRWFTQDSRAHEEIPASFAEVLDDQDRVVIPGLRRDLLTLEDPVSGGHPRFYDVNEPMSMKTIMRMMEFLSDFLSKPHQDFIWSTTIARIHEVQQIQQIEAYVGELFPKDIQLLSELEEKIAEMERIRQQELRYPELAMMYMLWSGRGYKDTTVADMANWQSIIETELAHNPAKIDYLLHEAQMLETGKIFLQTLGLSPSEVRNAVVDRWSKLDVTTPDFFNNCLPEMLEQLKIEIETELLFGLMAIEFIKQDLRRQYVEDRLLS